MQICGLYDMDPEKFLMQFCKLSVDGQHVGYTNNSNNPIKGNRPLFCFYFFSNAVSLEEAKKWKEGKQDEIENPPNPPHGPHDYRYYRQYQNRGKAIAEYLIENKLGTVLVCPAVPNMAYHPD